MSTLSAIEWHEVDADDRWPGRWTAHVTRITAHGTEYAVRITPGDHATYLAPGFYVEVDGGHAQRWGIRAATLEDAKAQVLGDFLADDVQPAGEW